MLLLCFCKHFYFLFCSLTREAFGAWHELFTSLSFKVCLPISAHTVNPFTFVLVLPGGRGIAAVPAGAVRRPRYVGNRQPRRLFRARSQYAAGAHKPSLQKKR